MVWWCGGVVWCGGGGGGGGVDGGGVVSCRTRSSIVSLLHQEPKVVDLMKVQG